MKQRLGLALLFLLIMGRAYSAGEAAVGTATAFAGDTVTVDITISPEVQNVAGADIVVQTPGTISQGGVTFVPISIKQFTPGPLWETSPLVEQRLGDDFNGRFQVGIAQARGFNGPGVLVRMTVVVSSAIFFNAEYPIRLQKVALYDPDANLIPVTVRDGKISVEGGRAGDLNGDGEVNVGDAVLALRIAIGLIKPTPKQLRFGDLSPVNPDGTLGDGKITLADATVILRRALGIPETTTQTPSSGGTTGGGTTPAGG